VNKALIVAAVAGALGAAAAWGNWPQYRGPNHDGTSPQPVAKQFPSDGSKVLWKVPLGEGFGSMAVSGGKLYVLAERKGQEACLALDANTGKEAWATDIDKTIFEGQGGNGPRTTPVIDGDRIYVLGTFAKLACLDAATGKEIWKQDLPKDFGGQPQFEERTLKKWGNAASPIVDGDLVIAGGGGPGQALIGFDKRSGKVVWKGQDDKITHATPTVATIAGTRQVIFFTQTGLVAVTPADGRVLWRHPYTFNVSTAASPVVGGDVVYCSAGYDVGGGAVKVTKDDDNWSVKEIWRTPGKTMSHWSTPVYHDGHLYGQFGFKEYNTEPLKCVEMASGKEVWSKPGFGQGQVILAGTTLLVQTDYGMVALVEAIPAGFKELGRAQLVGGKSWGYPAVSDGKLYVRSIKELACVDVSVGK
jgi:outer membrane protein assembly factor BamB